MDRIGKDLEQTYPTLSRGHGSHVTSLPEEITGPVERTLMVLMAAVGVHPADRLHQRDEPAAGKGRRPPARDGRALGDRRRLARA